MKILTTILWLSTALTLSAQTASIRGQLQSKTGEAISFANLGLYRAADGGLYKAGASDEAGIFDMKGLAAGTYKLKVSALGFSNLEQLGIQLQENQRLDIGVLPLTASGIDLDEVTVTASRVMVEIKPDRTVFNVEGTINSTGSDALTLVTGNQFF